MMSDSRTAPSIYSWGEATPWPNSVVRDESGKPIFEQSPVARRISDKREMKGVVVALVSRTHVTVDYGNGNPPSRCEARNLRVLGLSPALTGLKR
jgi:hypothetical protein